MMSTPKKTLHVDSHANSDTESYDVSMNSSFEVSSPASVFSDKAMLADDPDHRFVRFVNCALFVDGKIIPGELLIDREEGVILEPSGNNGQPVSNIDLDGLVVSPGFIDAQINGAFGFDFSDDQYGDGSSEAFQQGLKYLSKQMVKTGVTAFCPTLPSTFPHVYRKVLPSLAPERISYGSENLGTHLEGPFLSPKKPGCHPKEAIITAPNKIESFKDMYGEENLKQARIITVAAEQEGVMDSIQDLTKMGLVVSLGHSVLKYKGGCEAVKNGASMVTHIYNAMTQPHHRESGLFGLLGATRKDLSESIDETRTKQNVRPSFGIIVDGIHVHPSCVAIAYHANPEGCCVVTDAMSPMGLPSGTYAWSTQTIVKEGNHLYLAGTDTIAGSAIQLDESLRNLMEWTNIPLATALKTVTTNPARTLGVLGKKGTLSAGADADLTIIDAEGFVRRVYKLGHKVFQRASKA